MKGFIQLYFVLCFLLFSIHTLPFNSSAPIKLCPHDQSLALIQFNNSLTIDCSVSDRCPKYEKKTKSWEVGKSCCLWDGIKCESETSNVIGLDLSCSCLRGTIPSNSTFFHLHHLQHLNLAHNDFTPSKIALKFGQFSNLTHLNVSSSGFTGVIALQVSHLSKLQAFDLSYNCDLIFEGHVFEKLLGNLSQLRHLLLDGINMSSVLPSSFLNMSSYITTLTLKDNGLQGKFPVDVFRFPCLQKFQLINSNMEINLPKSNWTAPLRSLRVSTLSSSLGEIPDSIGNLKSLEVLDLSYSQLKGSIPASLGNLTRLNYFDLSGNLIHGPILFSFSNFKKLNLLDLSSNNLVGRIIDAFGNITKLVFLSLGDNELSGVLPISAFNLTQIEILDFSENKFVDPLHYHVSGLSPLRYLFLNSNSLSGKIPSWLFTLPSLVELRLSGNKLTGFVIEKFHKAAPLESVFLDNNEIEGPIPNFSKLVNLTVLNLSSNKLNGIFEMDKLSNFNKLEQLYLSNNALLSFTSGSNSNYLLPNLWKLDLSSCNISEFPDVVSNLQGLTDLNLSFNSIRVIEAQMFLKLKSLETLDLSNNSPLSLGNFSNASVVWPILTSLFLSSCNITQFPNFLTTLDILTHLDLSNNTIQGQISKEETKWGKKLEFLDLSKNLLRVLEYYPWPKIRFLNLRSNMLKGPFLAPPRSIVVFLVSKNKLTRAIPSSICKLKSMKMLDLSDNNLTGTIPECLGSRDMFNLEVMDLQMNNFHGNIPDSFVEGNAIMTLNLNKNNFDGTLPKSLINCHHLEVLNLGNNKINDTFPHWLGTFPQLQVLILRANYFHDQIIQPENGSHFSSLRILDLSYNEFSGFLPTTYFKSFKGMMDLSGVAMGYMKEYSAYSEYYQDYVVVTMKGVDIEHERILTIFSTIDMSSNKFEGKIPEIVGKLNSLQVLNFSHNSLTGHIPSSFGNLVSLESLDLSSNKLVGEIPTQLTGLNFLEVLNLSENQLVGVIPHGNQFDTFPNDSYVGNLGLCGFPLSKMCAKDEANKPTTPVFDEKVDYAFGLEWKFVMMGYGVGLVFGSSAGYIVLTIKKPKWLVKIIQRVGYKVIRRLMKRLH